MASALLDSFGRRHSYLRVSLTERCNLRCSYCMPQEGISLSAPSELLSSEELLFLCRQLVALGVSKIRLTGGEPTVRQDLLPLVASLRALPGLSTLAMTSNGLALSSGLLQQLHSAGLDALNLSLDTLQAGRFEALARRPAAGWAAVWACIQAALSTGYGSSASRPLKVNTVVQRGCNEDELGALAAALTQQHAIELRFIELMPFGGNAWRPESVVSAREMLRLLQQQLPGLHEVTAEQAQAQAQGRLADASSSSSVTARVFRGGRGWAGQLAFISTVSDAFCSSCSRLRLTADGALRVCLHDERETSLRDVLRAHPGWQQSPAAATAASAAIAAAVAAAVQGKAAALGGRAGGLTEPAALGARPMIKIGG